ncbi:MAG TPA: hypothetical protein VFM21_05920 [Terriglobia bacterium]|nr:hypothetical protein [Terriglobia bacterium]
MRPSCPGRSLVVALAAALLVASFGNAAQTARAQKANDTSLSEDVARAGVFFRADAPRVLRNPQDPYLPVFLEIINGVEQESHSSLAQLARKISRDPVELQGAKVFVKPAGASRRFAADPLLLGTSTDFTFDARSDGKPFAIPSRLKQTIEIPLATLRDYLAKHYFGGPFEVVDLKVTFVAQNWPDQDVWLRTRLSAPAQPQINGWYRGDIHYHSSFTDNPAERGHPLDVTKQAALQAGMDWLLLADHSTDLDADKYAEEQQEAAKYRDGRFVYIVGEEITTASTRDDSSVTLHMIALPSPDDPDRGFPDAADATHKVVMGGDGSIASLAAPLKEALARIAAAGGFAYAAHPNDPISPLLRGGSWDIAADFLAPGGTALAPALVGLEPWNRATDLTADSARDPFCVGQDSLPSACFQPDAEASQYARLEKGISTSWLPLLKKGLESATDSGPAFKAFIAAGSDAHGDFNYEATMDVTDFLHRSLSRLTGYAEDNALGKISTVVDCPQGMGTRGENVLRALRQGRSVLSNGPLLVAGFDMNGNGSLDDPEDTGIGQQIVLQPSQSNLLRLEWASSDEFGPLTSLRMIAGSAKGESAPKEIEIPAAKGLASGGLFPVDLRGELSSLANTWGYIRFEARTRNKDGQEFRCYTNPIWLRVAGNE